MIIILDQSMSHSSTRLLHVHTYIESTRWQVLLMRDDGEFYLCITITSFTYALRSQVLLMNYDHEFYLCIRTIFFQIKHKTLWLCDKVWNEISRQNKYWDNKWMNPIFFSTSLLNMMGLELTTDRYPSITSQMHYPLRHAASCLHLINLTNY